MDLRDVMPDTSGKLLVKVTKLTDNDVMRAVDDDVIVTAELCNVKA